MEDIYDTANAARRAKSAKNRRNTAANAVPDINVGDYVLYAEYKKHTKLDYTWLGPAVVTTMVSPLSSQYDHIHSMRVKNGTCTYHDCGDSQGETCM